MSARRLVSLRAQGRRPRLPSVHRHRRHHRHHRRFHFITGPDPPHIWSAGLRMCHALLQVGPTRRRALCSARCWPQGAVLNLCARNALVCMSSKCLCVRTQLHMVRLALPETMIYEGFNMHHTALCVCLTMRRSGTGFMLINASMMAWLWCVARAHARTPTHTHAHVHYYQVAAGGARIAEPKT